MKYDSKLCNLPWLRLFLCVHHNPNREGFSQLIKYCNFSSFKISIVLLPDNGPLNSYLETIMQLSSHSGRCRNKILESEVCGKLNHSCTCKQLLVDNINVRSLRLHLFMNKSMKISPCCCYT